MIVIIDYGMGNVASVQKALNKLGYENKITNETVLIKNADALILPGVGSYRAAMENLNKLGLTKLLKEVVLEDKKPILGICLGMQLLSTRGTEDGIIEGLNFIEGEVIKIKTKELPIPHIGWNDLSMKDIFLFKEVKDFNFYFVHSYYFQVKNDEECIATVEYETPITAVIKKDNIIGTQFHPEKSQTSGLLLLKNFLSHYA